MRYTATAGFPALVVGGLLALGSALPACGQERCGAAAAAVAPLPPIAILPVTLRVLQDSVTPVPATDGSIHIAYAAQLTNLSPQPIDVQSLLPTDYAGGEPAGRDEVVDGYGATITGKVRLFTQRAGFASQVPGGASGIVFFDVRYPAGATIPALLSHRIAVRDPATGRVSEALANPVAVACRAPIVLQPPLVGHGWWNGNGCCVVSAHRGAILPTNGRLMPPEQFAIDYAQIRADGGCCTGPTEALASWPFYGAPVLAAAEGRVVSVERDQPDQVPGRPVVGITAANAGGNVVIEQIDADHYVAYAHLRPGSIPASVVPDAVLHAGDRLGSVGNSGNSTAPHLHFQVMDRPSMLNAVGLPFVFAHQILEGRVEGSEVDADQRFEAGGRVVVDTAGAGARDGQMPASGQVFGYGVD